MPLHPQRPNITAERTSFTSFLAEGISGFLPASLVPRGLLGGFPLILLACSAAGPGNDVHEGSGGTASPSSGGSGTQGSGGRERGNGAATGASRGEGGETTGNGAGANHQEPIGDGGSAAGGSGLGTGGATAGGPSSGGGSLQGGSGGQLGTGGVASGGLGSGGLADSGGTGGEAQDSCPHSGDIQYQFNNSESWPADVVELLTEAMDDAVDYYNCYADLSHDLTVNYDPGVPTAEANVDGWISFGENRQYMVVSTAMHEISHTLGVGYFPWEELMEDGRWRGPAVREIIENLPAEERDPDTYSQRDYIRGDAQHFWPYGLNSASEHQSEWSLINHVRIVAAMQEDKQAYLDDQL